LLGRIYYTKELICWGSSENPADPRSDGVLETINSPESERRSSMRKSHLDWLDPAMGEERSIVMALWTVHHVELVEASDGFHVLFYLYESTDEEVSAESTLKFGFESKTEAEACLVEVETRLKDTHIRLHAKDPHAKKAAGSGFRSINPYEPTVPHCEAWVQYQLSRKRLQPSSLSPHLYIQCVPEPFLGPHNAEEQEAPLIDSTGSRVQRRHQLAAAGIAERNEAKREKLTEEWLAILNSSESLHHGPELRELVVRGLPNAIRGHAWYICSGAGIKAGQAGPGYYNSLTGTPGSVHPGSIGNWCCLDEFKSSRKIGGCSKSHPASVQPGEGSRGRDSGAVGRQIQIDKDLNGRTLPDTPFFKIHQGSSSSYGNEWPTNRLNTHENKYLPRSGSAAFHDRGLLIPTRRLLLAFSKHNPTIGFGQGMAPVAGVLLMNMPEEEAFWLFCTIYEDLLPNYMMDTESQPGFSATKVYVEELMQQVCPCVLEHLQITLPEEVPGLTVMMVMGDVFVIQMVTSIFAEITPLSATLRVMDLFFCHGSHSIFLAVVAVFLLCEDRILQSQSMMEVRSCIDDYLENLVDGEVLIETMIKVATIIRDPESNIAPHIEAIDTELDQVDGHKQEHEAEIFTISSLVEELTEEIKISAKALKEAQELKLALAKERKNSGGRPSEESLGEIKRGSNEDAGDFEVRIRKRDLVMHGISSALAGLDGVRMRLSTSLDEEKTQHEETKEKVALPPVEKPWALSEAQLKMKARLAAEAKSEAKAEANVEAEFFSPAYSCEIEEEAGDTKVGSIVEETALATEETDDDEEKPRPTLTPIRREGSDLQKRMSIALEELQVTNSLTHTLPVTLIMILILTVSS